MEDEITWIDVADAQSSGGGFDNLDDFDLFESFCKERGLTARHVFFLLPIVAEGEFIIFSKHKSRALQFDAVRLPLTELLFQNQFPAQFF